MSRHQLQIALDDRAATRYVANRRRMQRLEEAALTAIENWVNVHGQSWVAVSGGKDSTVLIHLVSQVAPQLPLVWFDSGLEYPQTRPYLESLAERWGLDLHVIPAKPDALTLLRITGHWVHGVLKADHGLMDKALIQDPQAEAMARWGNHGIYGIRAGESTGRAIALNKTKGTITKHRRDGSVHYQFLAPLWNWRITDTADDINGYAAHHRIKLHPVYEKLTALGVPARFQRVGLLVTGWGLDQGVWAKTHAIAPEYCRLIEQQLPVLAQYR